VNIFKNRLDKHWNEYNNNVHFAASTENCFFLLMRISAKGHQAYQAVEDGKWYLAAFQRYCGFSAENSTPFLFHSNFGGVPLGQDC